MRVLSEKYGERKLTLVVEGPANTKAQFPLFVHTLKTSVRVEGAELAESGTHVRPDETSAPRNRHGSTSRRRGLEDDHCDADVVIETGSNANWNRLDCNNYFLCFRYKSIK